MAVLQVLLAFAPISYVFSFMSAIIYDFLNPQPAPIILQFGRRRTLVSLFSASIVLSFVARAVAYLLDRSITEEHAFVYDLSQVLYHTTILLVLLTGIKPSPLPILAGLACSLIFEVVILGLTASASTLHAPHRLTISAITCGGLLLATSVTAASWLVHGQSCNTNETQPLLGKHQNLSTSTFDTQTSHADEDSNSQHTISQSEDWENDTEFSDDSDTSEKDLMEFREQKLQEEGVFRYMMSFRVFIPFLIPKQNLKLQFYAIVSLVNILLQRGCHVLHPFLLGLIIDQLTIHRTVPWLKIVLWVAVQALAGELLGLEGINEVLLARIAAWSNQSLKVAAFDKLMSLSMSYHDSKDSGEIIKAIEQASSLSELFKVVIFEIFPCILDIGVAIWFVHYLLDVYAMLVVIAVGVGFTFSTIVISRRSNKSRRDLSAKEREESKVLYEAVGNWPTVAFFNRKAFEIFRLGKVAKLAAQSGVHNNDLYIGMFAVQEIFEEVGLIVATMIAAYRISTGKSTVGDFVALGSYWNTITQPLYIIGHSYRDIQSAMVDAERLLQVFQTEISVKDKPNAQPIKVTDGEVEFSDVSFAYQGRQTSINQLNFIVKPGQTVALVGPTGAGKSTIVKLLMRFYDVDSGSILIDGQNISDVTQDSLRNMFGFVPQDNVLFNTNVLENVRYGRLDATDEDIYAACKAACIHEKVMSLPEGYRTRVGERGVKLSGGERQRIAIARVLLKDPRMVLLDEATSAMDSQTEANIQRALKNLTHGRTSFIIAHRLSTIVDADLILVVSDGRVVESGTHSELLASQGMYHKLSMKQIT